MPYFDNTNISSNPENINDPISLGYLNHQKGNIDGIASLDSFGQIPINQFPLNGLTLKGTWNASLNNPIIIDNSGNTGEYYVISVDGSSNIQGETNWNINDWIIFGNKGWEKIFNTSGGPNGDTGDQGIKGEKGVKNSIGEKGMTGEIGMQGVKGVQGLNGPTGPNGQSGIKGETGDKGINGDKGIKGITGNQGTKGDKGNKGSVGDIGNVGQIGQKGSTGIDGIKGDNGDQGPKGLKGNAGIIGIYGDTGDTGIKGETGIKGPTGDIGNKGTKGEIGTTGINGDAGDAGIKGDVGQNGNKGDKGPAQVPELIVDEELIIEYLTDSSGLIHPINAKYIEFTLIGGGSGGYSDVPLVPFQLGIGGGVAGKEKIIKRKLPGNFSFTVGNGGNIYEDGTNTTLVTDTGTIVAMGGIAIANDTFIGEIGSYNGYGSGGNGKNGVNDPEPGTQGIVIVTYS
jgi:hypothetical protein